jgi:hypothetical protein
VSAERGAARSRLAPALGWGGLAVLLLYALLIHNGVGAAPEGAPPRWWQPTGFLLDALQAGPLYFLIDPPRRGIVAGLLPALGLLAWIVVWTRSALARTLGLAAVLACALFLFYGLLPPLPEIWRFFGWRGSLAMCGLAGLGAAALASPLLAASWLRQPAALRVALYLPFFAGGVLLLRDVTGTDPSLRFAISPWPVVPFFGLEHGVPLVALLLACGALGLAIGGRYAWGSGLTLPGVAVALGLATGWATRFAMQGLVLLAAALLLAGAAALVAAMARRRGSAPGAAPALRLALAVLLLALPVAAGEALAARDWTVTRQQRAQHVIDALGRYYAREQVYPDSLEDLVRSKDLPAVPRPQIGSGLFGEPRFTYQSFGTSYLLEFSAPDWVQCAYSPPYADEDDTTSSADDAAAGDESGAGDAGDGAAGAWSCPSKPPELW